MDYKCTHPTWAGPTFKNGRLDNCKLGDLGGESFTGGRFALLWTPSDTVRVKVLGDLINQDNESAPLVLTRVTDARHTPKRGRPGHGPIQPRHRPVRRHVPRSRRQHGDDGRPRLSDEPVRDARPVPRRSGRERSVHHVRDVPRFDAAAANRPYSPQTVDPGVEFDDQGLSVQLDWDLSDNLSLKWISATREYEDMFAYDTDGYAVLQPGRYAGTDHEHTSHEVRLTGVGLNERLDWTVGAYYVDQSKAPHIGQIDLYYAQLNFIHGPDLTPSDSQAFFAHTAWHLTDKLDLSVGYRKTEDSKFYQWQRHNPDGSDNPCRASHRGDQPGGANSCC